MARQVKRPKRKSKAKLAAERAARAEQQKTDRFLILVAEETLADGRLPEPLRQLLRRFIELAKPKAERRPPGRPRSSPVGLSVEVQIERGRPKAEARKKMARHLRMSLGAVRRAHNRYLAQQRELDKTQS
jgi:hypothetical protein